MKKQKTFEIEWEAHEYEHKERDPDWFWAVGIITLSLVVASIIFGNIILGILILLSSFSLSLFINRHPETIHIVVDDLGVTKGQIRYPFETLHSFWIDIEHPHKKIILKSKKLLMPLIIIPLSSDIDPNRLEKTLLRFLPEEFARLPLAETVLEYLGF